MKLLRKIARVIILPLIFTSCADMFQEKIGMTTTTTSTSLADLLIENKPVTELQAPSQLFVSQGDSASTIRVSWTSVDYAQSYRLERAISTTRDSSGNFVEPEEGDFQVIINGAGSTAYIYNETHYEDEILSDPSYTNKEYDFKYFYRIVAENIAKAYGSSEYTEAVGGTLFAPPSETTATAGTYKEKVVISWKKSNSASTKQYAIYRSNSSDGTNAARIGTVKSNMTTFTDTGVERGKEYYYAVYAINSLGETSVASSLAMGYARAEGAPVQVTDVHVTNGRGYNASEIAIEWTGEADASYYVYRTSSKDSALTMIKSGITGSTSYSMTDSENLSPGIYYYYLVQPSKTVDGNLIKGQMSDSGKTSKTPAEGFILSPPTEITVTKTDLGHQICWEAAIGSSVEKAAYTYKVYGSDSLDGTFEEIDSFDAINIPEIDGKCMMNISNTRKYYKMTTCNQNGEESAESGIVAPAPDAAQNIQVSAYANLASEMGANWTASTSGVYPVKISWTAPKDASNVAGYYVYRSDKKDKGWKLLSVNNDEKTFMVTGTTFYDINVAARTKKIYYYRVLSLNTLQGGANYSDIKWGYGALTADQYMREYNYMVKGSQKKLTLMWKSGSTAKLGEETAYGALSGDLNYNAGLSGVSGRVIMHYTNYADFYIHTNGKIDTTPLGTDDETIGTANGYFLLINGNTNTSAGIDMSGKMDGTVTCKGMYPGAVAYDGIQIKGGAAGGGTYKISRAGFADEDISWTVGEE